MRATRSGRLIRRQASEPVAEIATCTWKDICTLWARINGANDGFHEAIGDAIALAITPEYLHLTASVNTVRTTPFASYFPGGCVKILSSS
jgi:hypothetical protein